MTDLVTVHHPVPHRYLPRRARLHRFGIGHGVTPVELRHVQDRPREVIRIGDARILSTEGRAWTVLRDGRENVSPDAFRRFLAEPDPFAPPPVRFPRIFERTDRLPTPHPRVLTSWAERSPLLFQDDGGMARFGREEPPPGSKALDDAQGRASADVRSFLDDTVRIHGDRVLIREERLVGLIDLHTALPRAFMGDHARGDGTRSYRRLATVAIRPDRLGTLWDMRERGKAKPVPLGPWDDLAKVPPELLGNDDVAWMANRLPALVLSEIRHLSPRIGLEDPDAGEAVHRVAADIRRLHPILLDLDRRSFTHSIRGDDVVPAMDVVREGVALVRRICILHQDAVPTREPRPGEWVYDLVLRLLDEEMLPRLHGGHGVEDEASLSTLAMR